MNKLVRQQTDAENVHRESSSNTYPKKSTQEHFHEIHRPKTNSRFRNFVSVICRQPILSKTEEVQLCKLVADGNKEARETLLRSNLRYVVKLAYKFAGYLSDKSQVEDLFNEGFKGLMQALDRFEYRKDNRFITYAYWWVMKSMRTYIEREQRRSFSNWKRLDDPAGNESDDTVLADFLIDHDAECPEQMVQQEMLREAMRDILANPCFSDKERLCMELTYYYNKTAKEIAESDGIKENTIKSHLFRAKRKLAKLIEERNAFKETFMTIQ